MNIYKFFVALTLIFLYRTAPGNAKIYDCFTFFNELDVLEMRLQEMLSAC